MSYSISVLMKSVDETKTMLSFFKEEQTIEVLKKIFPPEKELRLMSGNSMTNLLSFESLYFGNDQSLSIYSPQNYKNRRIDTNQTLIQLNLYHLFVWMACKSSYRTKNDNPCCWYDDVKIDIVKKDTKTENLKEFMMQEDGFYYRKKPKEIKEKMLDLLIGGHKEYLNILDEMKKLDSLYINYLNENKVTEKKKRLKI